MFDYTPVTYTDETHTCDLPGYASPLITREAIPVHGFKHHTCANCGDHCYFNREKDQWLHLKNDVALCEGQKMIVLLTPDI